MTTTRHFGWTVLVASLASVGCAHGRVTSQLVAARSAMLEARSAGAAELEPGELADAERVLAVAEAQPDGSPREAHFAYIADRRARRAMADVRRDRIEQAMALDTRDLEEAETGLATLDAEVLFDTDQAELRADAGELLAPIVEQLRASGVVAVVTGFTDERGSTEHNRELSLRRAEAVRAYLIAQGVPRASLVADGRGEASPIGTNATEIGRAMNRRVEIAIYPTATGSLQPARAQVAVASR